MYVHMKYVHIAYIHITKNNESSKYAPLGRPSISTAFLQVSKLAFAVSHESGEGAMEQTRFFAATSEGGECPGQQKEDKEEKT